MTFSEALRGQKLKQEDFTSYERMQDYLTSINSQIFFYQSECKLEKLELWVKERQDLLQLMHIEV